jgi:hypothetical protein
VRGEVEGDEELEQEGELRVGRGEETEEAGGGAAVSSRRIQDGCNGSDAVDERAGIGISEERQRQWGVQRLTTRSVRSLSLYSWNSPIRDHVQDGSKLASLAQRPRSLSINGIEEARDGVGDGAELGVGGHVG